MLDALQRLPGTVVDGITRPARRELALEVTRIVVGDEHPTRARVEDRMAAADGGLFGPDSVTWQVHGDHCLLAGGVRALLLQTMHPLAMAGVAEHSTYREDPLGRLARTAAYLGTVVYGTVDDARAAVAAVRAVHERVVGIAPDGRPYAANDPHLLTWVHHTLVDSMLRAYRRYGNGQLTDAEADRYVAEWAVVCDLFGAEPAATSVDELRHYFRVMRSELMPTPEARAAARFLLAPPLPLHARPAYGVIAAAAVGMLPRRVRRELWLPLLPLVDPLVVRPAATVAFRSLDWVMDAYPWAEPAA